MGWISHIQDAQRRAEAQVREQVLTAGGSFVPKSLKEELQCIVDEWLEAK